MNFLGIKVLIITDIDPVNKNEKDRFIACSAVNATSTSNTSLKSFFNISGDEIFSTVTQKVLLKK